MTILEQIIENKRQEVQTLKAARPLQELVKSGYFERKTLSLTRFLADPDRTGIIAEFKRKSPSRGMINGNAIIEEVTTGYFRSGASALSILTDLEFFGGRNEDLTRARELNPIPILRKEFIIDEYQVLESKSIGADAVLLIAAVLDISQTKNLARLARSLDLQVLLELHQPAELDHLNEYIDLVGVNNRDLNTFAVDTEVSVRMAHDIPADFVRISESGISSPLTIIKLKGYGYQGFLIGESFMRSHDPVVAFSAFVKSLLFDHD
jgi:indole-3-glycerol phosphate synthase